MDKDAGQKINWLNEGDDFGQSPEEHHFLNHLQTLEDEGHDVDPLAPFLLKEFRAGNLQRYADPDDYGMGHYRRLRNTLPQWSDWYRSRAHNRPGANLMDPNFTTYDMERKYEDWYDRHGGDAPEVYDHDDLDNVEDWYREHQGEGEALPRTIPKELGEHKKGDPFYSWSDIIDSIAPAVGRYAYDDGYDDEKGEHVYDHAREHGYIPELGEAYANWRDHAVPRWHDHNYDGDYLPSADELGLADREPLQEDHATAEEYQQAHEQWVEQVEAAQEEYERDSRDEAFNQSSMGQMVNQYNNLLAPHTVTDQDGNTRYYNEPPQAPGAAQQVVGSTGRDPRYFRWVFHPQDASVALDHNETDHPAYVKTHRDLAAETPGPNPTHGYAYKIHGGWRLTDYEHKPVEDPFMVAQIVQALRGQKTRPGRTSAAWDRIEPDFSQLRYGSPLEDS